MPRNTSRREFLQLAHTYRPGKDNIAGWLISEKLDGTRCFWDGGISRGFMTDRVPWASVTHPKTGLPKKDIKPVATGLWSRYGNPIMAPDWFLNLLPACPLDGELWAGRGNFQLCRSICAGNEPDPRFDQIQFAVYSAPSLAYVFTDGEIKNANMVRQICSAEARKFCEQRADAFDGEFHPITKPEHRPHICYEDELAYLREMIPQQDDYVYLHQQVRLPSDDLLAQRTLETFLHGVLSRGGEGVILRNPASVWTPKRHRGILKYKPYLDAEATIVGFTSGRETDKGSRLLGKIGALVTDFQGKRLELAGLTDDEREFATGAMSHYATRHPGEQMPETFVGQHFKVGQKVTFLYRELSDDGVPKEARFWRQREVE